MPMHMPVFVLAYCVYAYACVRVCVCACACVACPYVYVHLRKCTTRITIPPPPYIAQSSQKHMYPEHLKIPQNTFKLTWFAFDTLGLWCC